MATTESVAVLGMGRMGGTMAATLKRAGFDVAVYNRTRSKAETVADQIGAPAADTARDAAAGAPILVSSLADDAAVRDVYAGPDGAAAGLSEGSVVCEMSTIDPPTLFEVQPLIEERGAALLDTPVSGSVPAVEKGALTIMVGGDATALERARPVLDALASNIFHVGELGTGATMKLAVNALVHAINVAVSESLVLAERAGIDRATAYEVFSSGAGAAPFVHYKRDAFLQPDQAPVAFSVGLSAKDLDLIVGLAERVGVPMAQAAANRQVAAAAVATGFAEQDMSAIAAFLREARGTLPEK
jgi:3-hydroxyisobutyrate dehydrogenase-like beta-hydroxyacid dehydrogenase